MYLNIMLFGVWAGIVALVGIWFIRRQGPPLIALWIIYNALIWNLFAENVEESKGILSLHLVMMQILHITFLSCICHLGYNAGDETKNRRITDCFELAWVAYMIYIVTQF